MKPIRPAIARRRFLAIIAAATFCAFIAAPGLYHVLLGMGRDDAQRWRQMAADHSMAELPGAIETDLNQRFLPGLAARIIVNGVQLPGLHGLIGACVPGNDGWIFYSSDVAVTRSIGFLHPPYNHGLEAVAALAQLAADLKARHVRLLVVPVPAKASIYPEHLDAHYDVNRGPDLNPEHQALFDQLASKGVETLDLTADLWAAKAKMPVFFPTDTHWTQAAKRLACAKIAERIADSLPRGEKKIYPSYERVSHRTGDLISMNAVDPVPPDITETQQVLADAAGPIRPGAESSVMVIGDSFGAQFELDGAGFPQMLTQALGQDVRSGAVEGATPDTMLNYLNCDAHGLEHTRVVVMVFAMRHIGTQTWDVLPLSPGIVGFSTTRPVKSP